MNNKATSLRLCKSMCNVLIFSRTHERRTGGAAEAGEEGASKGGAPRERRGRGGRRGGSAARYSGGRRQSKEAAGVQHVRVDLSRHGETKKSTNIIHVLMVFFPAASFFAVGYYYFER